MVVVARDTPDERGGGGTLVVGAVTRVTSEMAAWWKDVQT